jgi:hypothetical protein
MHRLTRKRIHMYIYIYIYIYDCLLCAILYKHVCIRVCVCRVYVHTCVCMRKMTRKRPVGSFIQFLKFSEELHRHRARASERASQKKKLLTISPFHYHQPLLLRKCTHRARASKGVFFLLIVNFFFVPDSQEQERARDFFFADSL